MKIINFTKYSLIRYRFVPRAMTVLFGGLFLFLSSTHSLAEDKKTPTWTSEQIEFFEKKIRPVFVEHCQDCHGEDEQEGGFRIDSRAAILRGGDTGPSIVLGAPEKSELILALSHDPDGYQMPPDGKLPEDKIAAITSWVKQGAPWPGSEHENGADLAKGFEFNKDHWSLKPVKMPEIPKVSHPQWGRSEVDQFILAKLDENKLTPSGPAERAVLARRLYFDLIGLPPSPEQLEKFVNDSSPDAYQKLVRELLASPQYGERWARHWLDLVRFAETLGHEFDFEISHTSHYRDYVIRAFNQDVPFDQFAIEHIAGDLLAEPRYREDTRENESILGTGFFWMGQGKHSPVDVRAEQCDLIDNQIDVLTKAFLGTSVACARCHDHKFDPISIKDYYALSGILESSRRHYADIRDQAPLNETTQKIHELKQHHRVQLVDYSSKQLQEILDRLVKNDSEISWDHPDLNLLEHPLHPWKKLKSFADPKQFVAEKKKLLAQLVRRRNQQLQVDKTATRFASFENGLPSEWTNHGQAFPQQNQASETLIMSPDPWKPVREVSGPNTLHSGTASGRGYGVIRSETFVIDQPFIDYHLCRSGGNHLVPKRHRSQLKNGQIHLVIDGFQHIKSPIYGGLTLNIKVSDQPQWHRQNVKKWIGHRAYIEIFDEEEGSIQLDQIRFSSGGRLGEPPLDLLISMLEQESLTSPALLKQKYVAMLQQVVDQYRKFATQEEAFTNDERKILNALLKQVKQNDMEMHQPEWLDQFYVNLKNLESQLGQPNLAIATVEGSAINSYHLIRGNSKKQSEEVPRRFLEVLGGSSQQIPAKASGRLQLARQIASKENPLFDRVIVNRIWEHHFGHGLVETSDDFGKMGRNPSHPELLDFLTLKFQEQGRSIKRLHEYLLNTSTYRMKSDLRPEVMEIDPQNKLWHRMPIRRLEGEAIRDSILKVSGSLRLTMYGPSIPPFLTPFMEGRGRPSKSGPLDGDGRRSIYINVRRNFLTPMFLAFDYPLPMTTAGKRSVSNVPAQALTLLNNQFGTQQASLWARKLLNTPGSPEQRIQQAYLEAYSRKPNEKEVTQILKFVDEQTKAGRSEVETWGDVCHILFNVKEFIFIR